MAEGVRRQLLRRERLIFATYRKDYETCRSGYAEPEQCAEILAKSKLIQQEANRVLAGWTGLEPATSAVTGLHSNQLNYHPYSSILLYGKRLRIQTDALPGGGSVSDGRNVGLIELRETTPR